MEADLKTDFPAQWKLSTAKSNELKTEGEKSTTPWAGPGGDPGDLQQMGPTSEELFAVDATMQHQ